MNWWTSLRIRLRELFQWLRDATGLTRSPQRQRGRRRRRRRRRWPRVLTPPTMPAAPTMAHLVLVVAHGINGGTGLAGLTSRTTLAVGVLTLAAAQSAVLVLVARRDDDNP